MGTRNIVSKWLLGLLAVLLLFILFSRVAALVFPESPWAYELKYNTLTDNPIENVRIDRKPPDCDWDYAPLGRKSCHYEKEVSVIRFRTDLKTGQTMVTSDDGETWEAWEPLSEGEKPNPCVYVTWRKVQD